jgi:hypothetical protein
MAKITALDRDEFREMTADIYWKLKRKYRLTAPFCNNVGRNVWGGPVLIGGKQSWLEDEQLKHVRALANIARNTETLERKRAMVREQLMERLAA